MQPGRTGRRPNPPETVDARRAEILDRTVPLVAARGADNVRLRDVAAAAGVSIGTLQHYFTTRDQLLREAFFHHSREIVSALATAGSGTGGPWRRVERIIRALTQAPDLLERSVVWIEFAAASSRDQELKSLMTEVYEGWRRPLLHAIEEGLASGEFRSQLDAAEVVTHLLAIIDGYELAYAIGVAGTSPQTLQRRLLSITRVLLGVE